MNPPMMTLKIVRDGKRALQEQGVPEPYHVKITALQAMDLVAEMYPDWPYAEIRKHAFGLRSLYGIAVEIIEL